MKMTNEEIKKILDGAPEGATHWSEYYDYLKSAKNGYMSHEPEYDSWDYDYSCLSDTHRLSDLQEILELRQEAERLKLERDSVCHLNDSLSAELNQLREQGSVRLVDGAIETLNDLIDNPPEPTDALRKLMGNENTENGNE